jgi:parvulin-like peptidyl-prolyl isomerase
MAAVVPLQEGRWMYRALFILFGLMVTAGCSRTSQPVQVERSPVLATVDGRAITQADFDEEVERRRTRLSSLDSDTILQQLIEREAMLIKAEKAGLADSVAFRHETENRLISQWLSGTLHKERDAVAVTEKELEAAFETRKESVFRLNAQCRLAILYRKGKNVDELKTALAEAVTSFVKDRDALTQKGRLAGFGTLAASQSEDTVSRYRGGDLGWFDADKPESSRIPQEVLKAGVALASGDISEPLVVGDGVYVVMKSADREPHQIAYKEAAPALRRKLLSEKRNAVEASFKTGLLADVTVKIKAQPSFKPPPEQPLQPPSLMGGPQ